MAVWHADKTLQEHDCVIGGFLNTVYMEIILYIFRSTQTFSEHSGSNEENRKSTFLSASVFLIICRRNPAAGFELAKVSFKRLGLL